MARRPYEPRVVKRPAYITLRITPIQARVMFNTIDGAADAGACEGGCTPQERRAMHEISTKLLAEHNAWKHVNLDPG